MKNLILLFAAVVLVGVNANGADKPIVFPDGSIISSTGLEGIGESGMLVVVNDYSEQDKTFDVKAIQNQVALRLAQAGIKVYEEYDRRNSGWIVFKAEPLAPTGNNLYYFSLEANRRVQFEANGKTYKLPSATVWSKGGSVGKERLRDGINKLMDSFLLDYLKANPKKKED